MIRTINRFFSKNSRWLFGIFTVIIIIAFMDFLSPGTFGGCAMSSDDEVGTVFGEKVTYADMRDMMIDMDIFMTLYSGRSNMDFPLESTFSAYARVEAAKRYGIVVSDKEVADFIIKLPLFNVGGKFDVKLYDEFIKNLQSRSNLTADDINNAIRKFVMVEKLEKELGDSVVVSDDELQKFFMIYNAKTYAKRLVIDFKGFLPKVKFTDADIQKYFNDNAAKYTIPARSKALLACFEYDDPALIKEADKSITEAAMREYYELNKSRFTVSSGSSSVITPYEKAKAAVRINLRADIIKKLALQKAQIFARDVYDAAVEDGANCLNIFNSTAAKGKIKLIEVPYFSANDTKVGSIESANLVREILAAAADVPVSNAIAAEKGVYVGHAVAFEAKRPAKFEEVKAQVIEDYRSGMARQAAIDECEKLIASLAALEPAKLADAVNKDKRFKDVTPFTMATAVQFRDMIDMLTVEYTQNVKPGELSKLMFVPDGVAVAYVVKRELGTLKDFDAQKEMMNNMYRGFKVRGVLDDFYNYLNSQCVMREQK